jgi:hypothetical protein
MDCSWIAHGLLSDSSMISYELDHGGVKDAIIGGTRNNADLRQLSRVSLVGLQCSTLVSKSA